MNEMYHIINVFDPEYLVDSEEKYQTLIGFLYKTAMQVHRDYPDVNPQKILITYVVDPYDQR